MQDGYDIQRTSHQKSFNFDRDLLLTIYALLLRSHEVGKTAGDAPKKPLISMNESLGFVLKKIISLRQSAYSTTIAEDHALLKDKAIKGRHRMAIEVRLGEKEILAMAAHHCDQHYINIEGTTRVKGDASHTKKIKS